MEMKQFKKFAGVLVAVVIILVIGVFFKRYWGPLVAGVATWVCNCFGIVIPDWVTEFEDMACNQGDNNLGNGNTEA